MLTSTMRTRLVAAGAPKLPKLDGIEKGIIIFLLILLFVTFFRGCELRVKIDSKPSAAIKTQY
jgi:hypothetical protein